MRTILAGLLLCTALAMGEGHAQLKLQTAAEPDAEDIARGKALTEAGDCASCHTADPAKPFAGRQADRYPVRRHLFAQSDAGSRDGPGRLER